MSWLNKNLPYIVSGFVSFYIILGINIYVLTESRDIIKVLNEFGGVVSSAGSMAALLTLLYLIQGRKQERDDKDNLCVTYANYVLMVMNRQIYIIDFYLKDYLKDYDHLDPDRALNLNLPKFTNLMQSVEPERLMFLGISGNFDVVGKVLLSKENTGVICNNIRVRNKFLIDEILVPNKEFLSAVNKVLTRDVLNCSTVVEVRNVTDKTDDLLRVLIKERKQLKILNEDLFNILKEVYPEHKFIEPPLLSDMPPIKGFRLQLRSSTVAEYENS
jgi:hypothetical protein